MPHFTHTRRVAFAETDMAGIVHFSNFNKYMEETEHAFMRHVGIPMFRLEADGAKVTWPRVKASCSFSVPARYDDVLEIDLSVARVGEKSLSYQMVFRRGQTQLATGELTTVCCRFRHDQPLESIPIPDDYRQILAKLPA